MEQRISVITLGVDDLARARAFYEGGLGWRSSFANDEVAFYQLNGIVLSLYARRALAADMRRDSDAGGSGAIALAYNVRGRDEVDAVLAAAGAGGATILAPASEAVWGGYTGYFADPDGHAWEVAWNPGWPIDADGDVTVGP